MPAGDHIDALLAPRAMAVVGATTRSDSIGNTLLRQLVHGGFDGRLFAVNPRYDSVEGVPCVPHPAALPVPVEHVAGDSRVESLLDQALVVGARAATVQPRARTQLSAARELGFPVVLKTAAALLHSGEVDGVHLALAAADAGQIPDRRADTCGACNSDTEVQSC